jgi:Methyltransferase domain
MPEGFFDAYPRFFETGNTGRGRGTRLNARYEILIGRHRDAIDGKTIVDIGSHDGRWAFAALEAGAKHIIGVEPNEELVANARRNFEAYGIEESRYSFSTLDALTFLRQNDVHVETVFLFGILYHVHYHIELIGAVAGTGAGTVIIDTALCPNGTEERHQNTLSYRIERPEKISTGKVEIARGRVLAGSPSRNFLRLVFATFDYNIREIPWDRYLKRWGGVGLRDYAEGARGTFLARRRPTTAQAS